MDLHKTVIGAVSIIIFIILVFNIVASTGSDIKDSGDAISDVNTNESGHQLPLKLLFAGDGIIILIFMAGLLLLTITLLLKKTKGK